MNEGNKPKPARRVARRNIKYGGGRREEVVDASEQKPRVVSRNRATKSSINLDDCVARREDMNGELPQREKKDKHEMRRRNVTERKVVSSVIGDGYDSYISPQVNINHTTDYRKTNFNIPKNKVKNTFFQNEISQSSKGEDVGGQLLGQIEQGFKLKSTKHLMVDKSGPKISGGRLVECGVIDFIVDLFVEMFDSSYFLSQSKVKEIRFF